MSISGRRNPINIFIAGNNEIDQWNALITFVKSNFSDNFSVSSKSEDLRIDIDKSFTEKDGHLCHQPLPKSDQDEIIHAVQKEANAVYDTLRGKQKDTPVIEAVVVPVMQE